MALWRVPSRSDGCPRRLDRFGAGPGPLRRGAKRSGAPPAAQTCHGANHVDAATATSFPKTGRLVGGFLLRLGLDDPADWSRQTAELLAHRQSARQRHIARAPLGWLELGRPL